MPASSLPSLLRDALHQVVSYLSFSSGTSDPKTLAAWNRLYAEASEGKPLSGPPAWLIIRQWLEETAADLAESSKRSDDYNQAFALIRLIFSEALPAYLDRHKDLLFHQPPEQIFNGFFLGRVAERLLEVLSESMLLRHQVFEHSDGSVYDRSKDVQKFVDEALSKLDDYVGYRPVPLLENSPGAPYPGEWVRPIPLYIANSGVSDGPYRDLVSRALDALTSTAPAILSAAAWNPNRLSELSFDPRAYDFDHPVHRRANYIFGHWDPNHIDLDGYYDRFVVRQVVIEALLERVREDAGPDSPVEELIEEAASVLAGTILMGSGVSGWGPTAHTSDVTLKSLMDPIASYRDEFYHDRISRLSSRHQSRLREEMRIRRQPFGAARQHLNASLARLRARQLQHVQLARIYARIGYPDASMKQADAVPVTSARLMCRIDCLFSGGLRSLKVGDLEAAAEVPEQVFGLILRAVDCGACVDPWNILYFGGNFNLFPGPEHGVHDHRVDDLVHLVEQHFGYMARVWSEAAARDDRDVDIKIDRQFDTAAKWWRKYSAHTVASLEAVDPLESYESAKRVASALRLWHRGGAASGDVAFWAPHAELFDSPRAYALVIGALLERNDFVASMALLIQWLGNSGRIGLRLGGSSLPVLAVRWLVRLRMAAGIRDEQIGLYESSDKSPPPPPVLYSEEEAWTLARKFLDRLEANAEAYWSAPSFSGRRVSGLSGEWWDGALPSEEFKNESSDLDHDAGMGGDVFQSAYEDVTYRDTADDGNEGMVYGAGKEAVDEDQDDLEVESKRLIEHLSFLECLARMWEIAADIGFSPADRFPKALDAPLTYGLATTFQEQAVGKSPITTRDALRVSAFNSWAAHAAKCKDGLLKLLDAVKAFVVVPFGSGAEAMKGYDRRRMVRDSLLDRIIGTAVEISDARRMLCAILVAFHNQRPVIDESLESLGNLDPDDAVATQMLAGLIADNHELARARFPHVLESLKNSSLLYIPLSRGGDPTKIISARLRQRMLHHLLHRMPRRGLIIEAFRLVEAARMMEQHNPIGMGAVTEFDGLFRVSFRSMVESLIKSVCDWPEDDGKRQIENLISLLESLTESMLTSWLAHSQTLRLSSLELVSDEKSWGRLVAFIRRYGDPLFTQNFLKLSNIRAILHQGVSRWIDSILESNEEIRWTTLFEHLEGGNLDRIEAERWLSLVFESILDHHAEFLDYNSTTTQSDRGDLIYMFHDFLRLRVRYDRVAWNLKPVLWAHEALVRSRLEAAAEVWRASLAERISEKADIYVNKLRSLQREYAMRMPTVADRILERFVQPMSIDRMRALVATATLDAEANRQSQAFEQLEKEVSLLTQHPTGVGIDLPAWLAALEEEIDMVGKFQNGNEIDVILLITVPIRRLGHGELQSQLNVVRRQGRTSPYLG